jgi:cholesterol transport system auxiliary component
MRALRKAPRPEQPPRTRAFAAPVALAAVSLLATALLASGCAFLSKGEALTPRYFSPMPTSEQPGPSEPPGPRPPAPPELRIGRIEPAAYLGERIAYRISDNELAYYDDRRWTEPPEQFVRRALERELFESHAFRRVISGAAPTLDVELLSFEEVRQGTPRARLSLLITLRDERHALLERTLSTEAPLELGPNADAGPALARAMAEALGRATRDVAERVAAELRQQASSSVTAQGLEEPNQAQAE